MKLSNNQIKTLTRIDTAEGDWVNAKGLHKSAISSLAHKGLIFTKTVFATGKFFAAITEEGEDVLWENMKNDVRVVQVS